MGATIYLTRHATPDWSRTDLRYDIPPGPPLTEQGTTEAAALGEFLREVGVTTLYASPLERTRHTAEIAGEVAGVPVQIEENIAEWREGEDEAAVHARFVAFWRALEEQAAADGPIALVTHGGPVAVMLRELGMADDELLQHRGRYDRRNPLPPAGVWAATNGPDGWELALVFTPESGGQSRNGGDHA